MLDAWTPDTVLKLFNWHGLIPHHNTTDEQQFLCLIFQPQKQGPFYLFKEGILIACRRNFCIEVAFRKYLNTHSFCSVGELFMCKDYLQYCFIRCLQYFTM